jgi:hypothetical protein
MALIYKENSGSKVAGPDLRYVRLREDLLHVGPLDYRIEPYSALRKTGKGVFKQVWKIAVNLLRLILGVTLFDAVVVANWRQLDLARGMEAAMGRLNVMERIQVNHIRQ